MYKYVYGKYLKMRKDIGVEEGCVLTVSRVKKRDKYRVLFSSLLV